jgi:hypothetical protein
MTTDEKVRRAVDLARREVNRGQSALALSHLKGVQFDVEDVQGTQPWADYQLTSAEALAATNDRAAKSEFEEALARISNLHEPDAAMQMRAHEHFGAYLVGKQRRSLARQHYAAAKQLAVERSWHEDTARIQLLIIAVDLESDDDNQIGSLQNLRSAAKERGYTAQELLSAWMLYCGAREDDGQDILAARKRNDSMASVEYFRSLLRSIRNVDE